MCLGVERRTLSLDVGQLQKRKGACPVFTAAWNALVVFGTWRWAVCLLSALSLRSKHFLSPGLQLGGHTLLFTLCWHLMSPPDLFTQFVHAQPLLCMPLSILSILVAPV